MVVFCLSQNAMQGHMLKSVEGVRQMRKKIITGLALLSCCCGQAMAEPLSLEKTLRKVYQDNPSLEASRFGLKATHELYPQARAGWHPIISGEGSITSTDIDTGGASREDGATTKSMSVGAEQPIFRGFRTTSEIDSAKSRIKAGYDRLKQTEQDIFLRTVENYMNVIRDRMIVTLQQRNRDILAKELESLQARFDAGDVTRTDVKQAQSRLSMALAEEARAQGDLKSSNAMFEEVVGIMPPQDMVFPASKMSLPKTVQEMSVMADTQNPELWAARHDHLASVSDVEVAASDLYPHVTAFASYIKEYDPQPGTIAESETSAIGVRARILLYEGGKTRSQIREAKNRENQRYIQTIVTAKAVRSELIRNWSQYEAHSLEIKAREEAVQAARLSVEGVREEARLGERTVMDTLDAEQEMLEAEVALARAKRDQIVSSYALAASMGRLLPEHMGMGDIAYDPGHHYRAVSHRLFSTKED
jgi:outer membrane protein